MPAMSHPLFKEPSPEAQIWRYTDLAKFIAMLEHRALYVSNLLALAESDPYEGHFPDPQVDAFAMLKDLPIAQVRELLKVDSNTDDDTVRAISETNLRLVRGLDSRRGCVYVNCWHINEAESDAMWRLYTLQGQGIAVQSTYDRLVRCFHMAAPYVQIGKVGYFDYSTHMISMDNVFSPALNKRASFQHENELRVALMNMSRVFRHVIDRTGSRETVLDVADQADGFAIEVDLDILIERVVVSPKSPRWIVTMIEDLLRRYGLDKPVVWSPLYTLSGR
ncbi:MAG: hypothetical protein AAB403_05745 [Planctomycetota bacterium]